jgi:hypothetical protein
MDGKKSDPCIAGTVIVAEEAVMDLTLPFTQLLFIFILLLSNIPTYIN